MKPEREAAFDAMLAHFTNEMMDAFRQATFAPLLCYEGDGAALLVAQSKRIQEIVAEILPKRVVGFRSLMREIPPERHGRAFTAEAHRAGKDAADIWLTELGLKP